MGVSRIKSRKFEAFVEGRLSHSSVAGEGQVGDSGGMRSTKPAGCRVTNSRESNRSHLEDHGGRAVVAGFQVVAIH